MEVSSLGYMTDLLVLRLGGSRIADRGDCTVVETPGNPGYYWGNFLLFPDPPGPGDRARWEARFEAALGGHPERRHRTFGWDDPEGRAGAASEFVTAGYQLSQLVVLAARAAPGADRRRVPGISEAALAPAEHHDGALEVRPIVTDDDWALVLASRRAEVPPGPSGLTPEYDAYICRQTAAYRAMSERGAGWWFGAFVGGELAGSLGLYVDQGVGRYQSVFTEPRFRRRGVCRTLVYRAARHCQRELGAEVLVIVAEAGSDVVRVYESVGFRITERQAGLSRAPLPAPAG